MIAKGVVQVMVAVAAVLTLGAAADAQGRGRRGQSIDDLPANVPYDGRFTFARIRYQMNSDGFGGDGLAVTSRGCTTTRAPSATSPRFSPSSRPLRCGASGA
jgi:hypothetical protein